jgi:phosphatidylglycerol:prolipoprotein diacylglycerol transferase
MYPEICRIGPFTVYSYGLMLVTAFLVATFLACIQARKEHISPDMILNLTFGAFVSGVIGARLFYVAENLPHYLGNLPEIIMFQRGGLSWFGGLISGIAFSIFYIKYKKLPVYRILDLVSPFVALAQGIGRIGCLLNGCCFGDEGALIPIQLYSSLALIAIYAVLRFLQERPHRAGEIFYAYLLLYSVKRFIVEFWRQDNPRIFQGLTLFHFLSLALFLTVLPLYIHLRRKRYAK